MASPPRLSPLQRVLSQEGSAPAQPCCALPRGSLSLLTAPSLLAPSVGCLGTRSQACCRLGLALHSGLCQSGLCQPRKGIRGTGLKCPCFGAVGTSPLHGQNAADLRHLGTWMTKPLEISSSRTLGVLCSLFHRKDTDLHLSLPDGLVRGDMILI